MRISDWSSDVCSSDLYVCIMAAAAMLLSSCGAKKKLLQAENRYSSLDSAYRALQDELAACEDSTEVYQRRLGDLQQDLNEKKETNDRMVDQLERMSVIRSEKHTSELQSLMRNSYAVFCLKKKKK